MMSAAAYWICCVETLHVLWRELGRIVQSSIWDTRHITCIEKNLGGLCWHRYTICRIPSYTERFGGSSLFTDGTLSSPATFWYWVLQTMHQFSDSVTIDTGLSSFQLTSDKIAIRYPPLDHWIIDHINDLASSYQKSISLSKNGRDFHNTDL